MYIESDEERIRDVSLHALGAGRRIASTMGATLCAFVQTSASAVAADSWVQELGQAGADKVIVVANDPVSGPPRWSNHGASLHAVCERMEPVLTLMASTAASRDIGPRLAARLASDYVANAYIDLVLGADMAAESAVVRDFARHTTEGRDEVDESHDGDDDDVGPDDDTAASFASTAELSAPVAAIVMWDTVVLSHGPAGKNRARRIPIMKLRKNSVVTLRGFDYPHPRGLDDADALHMPYAEPRPNAPMYLDSADSAGSELISARVVVCGGGGVASAEVYRLLGDLARALGGALAATATLTERGLAPANRAVGGGRHLIAPDLYICCAASGSEEHLAGISPQTTIVAINNDPNAAIFAVADYGLVGDVEAVVPQLIAGLGGRVEESPT